MEQCVMCGAYAVHERPASWVFVGAERPHVIIRNVPGDFCDECGEKYVRSEVSETLRVLVESLRKKHRGQADVIADYEETKAQRMPTRKAALG